MAQVELESVYLRVKKDLFHPLTARFCHEPLKQLSPQTPTTEFSQNCEAANLTGGLQPARANCITFRVKCERVHALHIGVVPFVSFVNALFDDEYRAAHAFERHAIALPGRGDDCEFCV
jgi:hypothetical protein